MARIAYPDPCEAGAPGLRTSDQVYHWLGIALAELPTLPANDPNRAQRAIILARGLAQLLEAQTPVPGTLY
jgi:hypothetical protein